MVGDGTWLTVGEAATRLGVHEDTIRRYGERNFLTVRRLPSGHRRVLAADVDRLVAQGLPHDGDVHDPSVSPDLTREEDP